MRMRIMRRFCGWRIIIIAVFGCGPLQARAATSNATTIYSTSFEASEGFALDKPLDGQPANDPKAWYSYGVGGSGIVTNFFDGQPQTAFIGFTAATNQTPRLGLSRPLDFKPLEQKLPLVTFSVLMSVHPSTTTNQDFFDWSVYNTDNQLLFSLSFPSGSGSQSISYLLNDNSPAYLATSQTFSNSVPYTMTIQMDFAANLWSASLGSTPIVTKLPITSTNTVALTLGGIDAQWSLRDSAAAGDDFMVFDDYKIIAEPAVTIPTTTVSSTSFEASEGYLPDKPLDGQPTGNPAPWFSYGTGGNGIVTNFFNNEPQSGFIGFTPPADQGGLLGVSRHLDFKPLDRQLPNLTFSVLMEVHASTTTNQDFFDWTVYNTDDKFLFSLSFPAGQGAQSIAYLLNDSTPSYVETGQTFSNSVPYLLTIRMDFASNLWSANLGSASLVAGQPITTTNSAALTLGGIDAQWALRNVAVAGDNFMAFDNYQIVAQPAPGSAGPSLQLKSRSPQGEILLGLAGQPAVSYSLDASTNLVNWTSLTTVSSQSGNSEFKDTNAPAFKFRFYRARQAPAQ